MVLYGITLVLLVEELMDAYYNLLSPFYNDDAEFDRSARRSAAQLRLLMDWGSDWGYFHDPAKYLFITDNPDEKEETRREFEQVGLDLNLRR